MPNKLQFPAELRDAEHFVFEIGYQEEIDVAKLYRLNLKYLAAFSKFDEYIGQILGIELDYILFLEESKVGSLRSKLVPIFKDKKINAAHIVDNLDDGLKDVTFRTMLANLIVYNKHKFVEWAREGATDDELRNVGPWVKRIGDFVKKWSSILAHSKELDILDDDPSHLIDASKKLASANSELAFYKGHIAIESKQGYSYLDAEEVTYSLQPEETDIEYKWSNALRIVRPDLLGRENWQVQINNKLRNVKVADSKFLMLVNQGDISFDANSYLDCEMHSIHRAEKPRTAKWNNFLHYIVSVNGEVPRNKLKDQKHYQYPFEA